MKDATLEFVRKLLMDFAGLTGLEPVSDDPKRYLWTDAFAVCNYLELARLLNDEIYMDLALRLVDQVHHTLGKHRNDDPRTGWLSGLKDEEGELHPTSGGLRIGKKLNERKPDEPYDDGLEWDQDGQYYHYLTKWMHALNCVARVTEDQKYNLWALELAQSAHSAFTYLSPSGRKTMHWKMSIDLSYPLVPSMGQHDPLDGFVTYNELEVAAEDLGLSKSLAGEIAEIKDICKGSYLTTNDPLGIGGLLSDASRVAQLMMEGLEYGDLLETILDSGLLGMKSFGQENILRLPPHYRLAFRELGLSIGLHGIEKLQDEMEENSNLFGSFSMKQVESLVKYVPVGKSIENFWMKEENRKTINWTEHREINMVMLATSLIPGGFYNI